MSVKRNYSDSASKQLGSLIRGRRKALGVTQLKLAAMCKLAPNTIIQLERGTGNARLDTLLGVLDMLGLQIDLVPKRLGDA